MSANEIVNRFALHRSDNGWVFVSRLMADDCVAALRAIAKPGRRVSRTKRQVRADTKSITVYVVTVRAIEKATR